MSPQRVIVPIGGDVIELPRDLWPPRAEAVLAVGRSLSRAGQFTDPGDAIPIYPRRPEAEELWAKRHPEQAGNR